MRYIHYLILEHRRSRSVENVLILQFRFSVPGKLLILPIYTLIYY